MQNKKQNNSLELKTSKDSNAVFNIIEYATMSTKNDGTVFWNRHHFCDISEEYSFPTDCNHFQSHFLHSNEIVEYLQNNTKESKGSISGYDGLIWINSLVLDIDNHADLEKSLTTLRTFMKRLKLDYGVDRRMVTINFSGKKGFHIRIPVKMFGLFKASANLHDVIKSIMLKLTQGLEGFDETIYKKVSLVRIINSKHADSGLYAIPLTAKEIRDKTIEEIKELAKMPRILTKIDEEKIRPYQKLIKLKKECIKRVPFEKDTEPITGGALVKQVKTGHRHDARLKLVRTMAKAGAALVEIKGIALHNNKINNPSDRENESTIIKEVEEMYSSWNKKLKFFTINNEGKVKITYSRYLEFLEKQGYAKYCMGSDYVIVKNENNCLAEIHAWQIKNFVREYLSSVKGGDTVYEFMLQRGNKCFSESFLEHLNETNTSFIKDTIDTCNFFFKNCIVSVNNKGEVITKSYDNVKGLIWKNNLLNRDFQRGKWNGDFRKFIKKVSGKTKRFNCLRSILGYLLHRYKDPSHAKAVILYDEKVAVNPMGRTGKSIIGKAISKIRKRAFLDGRTFNPKSQFAFQQVTLESEIIDCNDVRPEFPFESLFSIITDDMTIEKKNRDSYTIPFADSPKILISTNFALSGIGDSYKDRKIEFEFTDHYNANHKPTDDFGKMFFDGWDEDEWSRFDNFMINCVKYYLQNGVKEVSLINVNKRRIIDATSEEFFRFVRRHVKLNIEYNFHDLHDDYNRLFPEEVITPNMFTKWLKKYAAHMEYKYKERMSSGTKYVELKKLKNQSVKK